MSKAAELACDADRLRLLCAREAASAERCRVRCKRCRSAIPPGKRRDALYCSMRCRQNYRWEQLDRLKREIRHARRSERTVPVCGCGTSLNTTPSKPGPVPRQCGRCYQREYMRRYRTRPVVVTG